MGLMIPDLSLLSTNLVGGIVGSSYYYKLPTNNETGLTWDIISGSLPDGLTINQDSEIVGNPLYSGKYEFTLRVSKDSLFSYNQFFIIIYEPLFADDITNEPLTVGVEFNQNLSAMTSDGITWDIYSGSLPDGIILSSDGLLYGIPLADGEYTFMIRARGDGVYEIREFFKEVLPESTRLNSFDHVIERFLRLIELDREFFAFYNVEEDEALKLVMRQATGYLMDAIDLLNTKLALLQVNFYDFNRHKRIFNFDITPTEVGILARLMREVYLDRELARLKAFSVALTSNDMRQFSPANERKTFLEMVTAYKQENHEMLSNYIYKDRLTGQPRIIDFALM